MGSEKDAICQRLTGCAEGGKKETRKGTDAPTDFEIMMMMMKMMARKKEES